MRILGSTFNKAPFVTTQGATNVFLRIDGQKTGETELFLPLGYKPSVLDHVDTVVSLTLGKHVLTLATRSLDGTRATRGNALVDRITLTAADPAAATIRYDVRDAMVAGDTATFWVYGVQDEAAKLTADASGPVQIRVNDRPLTGGKAFLLGGINKVVLTTTGCLRGPDVTRDTALAVPRRYVPQDSQVAGSARKTCHVAQLCAC